MLETMEGTGRLERVLTEEQVARVVRRAAGAGWELVGGEVRPAADGLLGYLADHLRAELRLRAAAGGGGDRTLHLFVKRVPAHNRPKADFIHQHNYFKREALMLRLLDTMRGADGPNPWGVPAYLCTDSLIVMPDMAVEGYRVHPLQEPLDLPHALLAAGSLARYHAAFTDHETGLPADFYETNKHVLEEATFKDTPWLRTAAKLTADILDAFSAKYSRRAVPALEERLAASYVAACASLQRAAGTLNVALHKDLWNNNILFRYAGGAPCGALLVDYQCVRYGPPAFDLVSFLYLCTSAELRGRHEGAVLAHYWRVFAGALHDTSNERLAVLGYSECEFRAWCERSRMFGLMEAAAILPQVLMEARAAAAAFDDPATFSRIVGEDRSPPVLQYARHHPDYTRRNLEVAEEYVQRFILTCFS